MLCPELLAHGNFRFVVGQFLVLTVPITDGFFCVEVDLLVENVDVGVELLEVLFKLAGIKGIKVINAGMQVGITTLPCCALILKLSIQR